MHGGCGDGCACDVPPVPLRHGRDRQRSNTARRIPGDSPCRKTGNALSSDFPFVNANAGDNIRRKIREAFQQAAR
jgi:hypothetical protein